MYIFWKISGDGVLRIVLNLTELKNTWFRIGLSRVLVLASISAGLESFHLPVFILFSLEHFCVHGCATAQSWKNAWIESALLMRMKQKWGDQTVIAIIKMVEKMSSVSFIENFASGAHRFFSQSGPRIRQNGLSWESCLLGLCFSTSITISTDLGLGPDLLGAGVCLF